MEQTEWLPVVEFDGQEFVVDVAARAFRRCNKPAKEIGFYSTEGRAMMRAIVGTQWHGWMPREAVEELVV